MKNWLKLIGGVLLILAFVAFAPKIIQGIPMVNSMNQTIEEKGIEANALFYSEEVHTSEAQSAIKNSLTEKK